MRKYENMNDYYNNVVNNGILVATTSGNWDFFTYNDILYSIPKAGTGAGASVWCGLKSLKAHLYSLSYRRGYDSIIPPDWTVENNDFFRSLGIA